MDENNEAVPEGTTPNKKRTQDECTTFSNGYQQNSGFSITLFTKAHGILTKKIYLNPDGTLRKDSSQCFMSRGVAERVHFNNLKELADFLPTVELNQAIAHGTCGYDNVKIVSAKKYRNQPGTIARTKDFFNYTAGPTLAMIDYDPDEGQPVHEYTEIIRIIDLVCPGFADTPKVLTPSTSSYIFECDREISGAGDGFHLYFLVANGLDLPTFAEVLFRRLWLAGCGYIKVSRSGALLPRTIFDRAVFSPERLDFVAGANLMASSLSQRRPAPLFIPGGAEC